MTEEQIKQLLIDEISTNPQYAHEHLSNDDFDRLRIFIAEQFPEGEGNEDYTAACSIIDALSRESNGHNISRSLETTNLEPADRSTQESKAHSPDGDNQDKSKQHPSEERATEAYLEKLGRMQREKKNNIIQCIFEGNTDDLAKNFQDFNYWINREDFEQYCNENNVGFPSEFPCDEFNTDDPILLALHIKRHQNASAESIVEMIYELMKEFKKRPDDTTSFHASYEEHGHIRYHGTTSRYVNIFKKVLTTDELQLYIGKLLKEGYPDDTVASLFKDLNPIKQLSVYTYLLEHYPRKSANILTRHIWLNPRKNYQSSQYQKLFTWLAHPFIREHHNEICTAIIDNYLYTADSLAETVSPKQQEANTKFLLKYLCQLHASDPNLSRICLEILSTYESLLTIFNNRPTLAFNSPRTEEDGITTRYHRTAHEMTFRILRFIADYDFSATNLDTNSPRDLLQALHEMTSVHSAPLRDVSVKQTYQDIRDNARYALSNPTPPVEVKEENELLTFAQQILAIQEIGSIQTLINDNNLSPETLMNALEHEFRDLNRTLESPARIHILSLFGHSNLNLHGSEQYRQMTGQTGIEAFSDAKPLNEEQALQLLAIPEWHYLADPGEYVDVYQNNKDWCQNREHDWQNILSAYENQEQEQDQEQEQKVESSAEDRFKNNNTITKIRIELRQADNEQTVLADTFSKVLKVMSTIPATFGPIYQPEGEAQKHVPKSAHQMLDLFIHRPDTITLKRRLRDIAYGEINRRVRRNVALHEPYQDIAKELDYSLVAHEHQPASLDVIYNDERILPLLQEALDQLDPALSGILDSLLQNIKDNRPGFTMFAPKVRDKEGNRATFRTAARMVNMISELASEIMSSNDLIADHKRLTLRAMDVKQEIETLADGAAHGIKSTRNQDQKDFYEGIVGTINPRQPS